MSFRRADMYTSFSFIIGGMEPRISGNRNNGGTRRFNYSIKSKIKSRDAIGSLAGFRSGDRFRASCVIRGKYVHKSLPCAGEGRKCGTSDAEKWVEHGGRGDEEGGEKKVHDSAHASSVTFNGKLWSQITCHVLRHGAL